MLAAKLVIALYRRGGRTYEGVLFDRVPGSREDKERALARLEARGVVRVSVYGDVELLA